MAKATVTYMPKVDGDPAITSFHGVKLKAGEAVETTHEKLIRQAAANPWFKVVMLEDFPVPQAGPYAGAKAVHEGTPIFEVEKLGDFDHDRDGKPGGSLPADGRLPQELLDKAAALGIEVDRRWGAAKLQAAIDEAEGPTDDHEYRAHAVEWINAAQTSAEMQAKWDGEADLREKCRCGQEDVDWLMTIYQPKFDSLVKREAETDEPMHPQPEEPVEHAERQKTKQPKRRK